MRQDRASLRSHESGQSLIFAAVSMFALLVLVLMVIGIGEATSTQIRLQHAADAAAYAGAQLQADCLANIAWINEGMAEVYYKANRYALDNIVYSVLATMAESPETATTNRYPFVYWDPTKIGLPYPNKLPEVPPFAKGLADRARKEAEENIPRCERWLKRLSQIQRAIAVIAPALVEHQVYFTAQKNFFVGKDVDRPLRIAIYPHFRFIPDEGPTRCAWLLKKIGDPGTLPNGWFLEREQPERPLVRAECMREVPLSGYEDQWYVSCITDEGDQEKEFSIRVRTRTSDWPRLYHAEIMTPSLLRVEFTQFSEKHFRWEIGGEWVEIKYIDARGGESPSYDISFSNQPGYQLRRGPQGWEQRSKGGGWATAKDPNIVVNDVQVNLEFQPYIVIKDITIWFTWPCRITLGPLHALIPQRGSIEMEFRYGCILAKTFSDAQAAINELYTNRDGDGRWRPWPYTTGSRDTDKIRHRLLPDPDRSGNSGGVTADADWRYEKVIMGAYLEDMDMRRFAAHCFLDHDPLYNPPNGRRFDVPNEKDDALWSDPETMAQSLWSGYPLWAQPPRAPNLSDRPDPEKAPAIYQAWQAKLHQDRQFGGFYNLARGEPYQQGDIPREEAYSQTRECPYCRDKGFDVNKDPLTGPLIDYAPLEVSSNPIAAKRHTGFLFDDSQGGILVREGLLCKRPCGFWHERYPNTKEGMEECQKRIQAILDAAISQQIYIESQPWQPILRLTTPRPGYAKLYEENGTSYYLPYDEKKNEYILQVYCPLGCSRVFRYPPYYCDQEDAKIIAEQPSRVRRTIQHAIQSLQSGTPAMDLPPHLRQIDGGKRHEMGHDKHDERDYFSICYDMDTPCRQPLQLTDEFFRESLVVIVALGGAGGGGWIPWEQRVAGAFGREGGGGVSSGWVNPFGVLSQRRQHIAFAAARPFFASPEENGSFITNFRWASDNEALLAAEEIEPEDTIKRRRNYFREKWLRSSLNLFEPRWSAALVPIERAYPMEERYSADELEVDNSTRFVLSMIRDSYLREGPAKAGEAATIGIHGYQYFQFPAPPMQRVGEVPIDVDHPNFEHLIRH